MTTSFNPALPSSFLASALHGLTAQWQRTQARRRKAAQVQRELEAYTDRELADIGLCRSDIPALARAAYDQA